MLISSHKPEMHEIKLKRMKNFNIIKVKISIGNLTALEGHIIYIYELCKTYFVLMEEKSEAWNEYCYYGLFHVCILTECSALRIM